jgi:hypothetical protein
MFKEALLSVLLVVGAARGSFLDVPESGTFAGLDDGLHQRGQLDGELGKRDAHEKRQSSSQQMLHDVYNKYSAATLAQLPSGRCTKDNIAVRKEW